MGAKDKVLQKKYKSEWKQLVFLLFAVIVFLVVLVSTVFNDVVQIYNNKRQTEELEVRYNELLEEEASLTSEVSKLQDPDYQARFAREKYLYTKEGEKILTIIDKTNN
ncbi:MAG: septum formation initiator family protein [Bacilli bacterium]|nr:septum formation initiator family protein [Bacilli bacterium]